MSSSTVPFIPIVEDVESTRVRLPSSSVTPSSRELVKMNQAAYLYLPRCTRAWQEQWDAYRQMRENASRSHTLPFHSPAFVEEDRKNVSSSVESHVIRQLPSVDNERMVSSLSTISYDCCVKLLNVTEKMVTGDERWEEEKGGLSSFASLSSRKKNAREEDQVGKGEEAEGCQQVQEASSPTIESRASAVVTPSAAPFAYLTPHLLKEWWESALSMWFLPQQDFFSLPSASSSSDETPGTTSTSEKEVPLKHVSLASAESTSHSVFLPTTAPSPSHLALPQRKERMERYLRQRFFSFSHRKPDASTVRMLPAEKREDLSSSCEPWPSTPYRVCTLWEDRRRGIDDFTLSIAPLPFLPPACANTCSHSSSLTPSAFEMGTREAKKNTFASRVLYPEDVPRMDPFAFRSRVSVLWDLAEAISHRCTDKPSVPMSSDGSDTRPMQATDFSSVLSSCSLEASSSPSANGVSILLSYLCLRDDNTTLRSSSDAVSSRVRKLSGLQVAGLLRCRVLVELCVLRLSGSKINARCPFQWRTAAHFFFSLAKATSSACWPSFYSTLEKVKKTQKVGDDVDENRLKASPVSLLLFHLGAYVHHVIIPYLSMKDRQLWNRSGKNDVLSIPRNTRNETTVVSSLPSSTEPNSVVPNASPPSLLDHAPPQAAVHTTRVSENHRTSCSAVPIPFPAVYFPFGFLKESVRAYFPSFLQSAVNELLASSASKPAEAFEGETKEEEKEREKEEGEPFLSEGSEKEIIPSVKKDVEGKEKIACFLVELLFFQCGWIGDTIIHEDVNVAKTRNTEEKDFFEMLAISRGYLEHGISFASDSKMESILPSSAVEKKAADRDGVKHTSKGQFFLLRDVLRSQEGYVRNDIVEEGNSTSDSFLSSDSDAFSTAVRVTNVFHSSLARRTALKEFFIKYFLSDPRSAFDKSLS